MPVHILWHISLGHTWANFVLATLPLRPSNVPCDLQIHLNPFGYSNNNVLLANEVVFLQIG